MVTGAKSLRTRAIEDTSKGFQSTYIYFSKLGVEVVWERQVCGAYVPCPTCTCITCGMSISLSFKFEPNLALRNTYENFFNYSQFRYHLTVYN